MHSAVQTSGLLFPEPHTQDLARTDHHLRLSAPDYFAPYQFNHNQFLFRASYLVMLSYSVDLLCDMFYLDESALLAIQLNRFIPHMLYGLLLQINERMK